MQIAKHAGDVATKRSTEDSYQSPTSIFPTLYIFTSISNGSTHHSLINMEKTHTKSALKFVKASSQSALSWSSTARGMTKDELKDRLFGKSKTCQKPAAKENTTKPQDFKLHTQERALKRAMFNYEVATKLYIIEQQKKQAEKLQKMIEEEEVRMLRKEMVPRAQLMPFFDRPFFPQRSNRALTVPREPSFHMNGKCGNSLSWGVMV